MRRVTITLFLLLGMATPSGAQEISFRNEVMAVLSKAGCSAGVCHGNKNGKGGLKLSLRGQDPDLDYMTLTRDLFGRRSNLLAPDTSLLLLKPSAQIAHEGGRRFPPGSPPYEILKQWIARGMPNDLASAPALERLSVTPAQKVLVAPEDQLQLSVRAEFTDGSSREVSALAVYEPVTPLVSVSESGLVRRAGDGETTVLVRYLAKQLPVRLVLVPARPTFRWQPVAPRNYVDEHIFAKLRTVRLNASELCSDEVFLRRAYLDLLGILPEPEAARRWVRATPDFARRARLIDELLARAEFADFWALKWADLLRVEAHSLDPKGVHNFHHWIRTSVATNKPLDEFVRELIVARGSTYHTPAANYYRPHRDPAARAKAVAQIFLGTRLQCAECHNHPSDRWTQDDYYDWSALFAGVAYKVLENNREIGSDKHEWKGEQVIFATPSDAFKNPRTGKNAQPRFLGAGLPGARQDPPVAGSTHRLDALAAWVTHPDNPWFARVHANRIWSQLLGRGLVEPPDDFRATNPASHAELLDALAADFVQHRFDVRHLIRRIMNSRTYQLSSAPNDLNAADEINYSHALVRRLGAEQLLDAQSQVAGVPLRFTGYPRGLRAAQLPGVRPEGKNKRRANSLDQFLELFGKPPRLMSTDTERSCECNMGQAFQLISGPAANELLADKNNRIQRLLTAGIHRDEMIQQLYWAALTRAPTDAELRTLQPMLEPENNRRAALEDLLWALLNSKDFLFRP